MKGFIVERIFDNAHFTAYSKSDTPTGFSGQIVYYTEEGQYLGGQAYKNGISKGQVIVSLDGSAMKNPNSKGARQQFAYLDCEIISVRTSNCPQRPAQLGSGSNAEVPTSQADLDWLFQNCGSVTLELGNCTGSGGGGNGSPSGSTTYTPPAGFTPYIASPYGGGSSGPNYNPPPGGYYLTDEDQLAIAMISRNLEQLSQEERQLLRSQSWTSEMIQGIVAETGRPELDVIREAFTIWTTIDPVAIQQQLQAFKTQSQQDIASAIVAMAEYMHDKYLAIDALTSAHPKFKWIIQGALHVAKFPFASTIDTNPTTLNWFDLFTIWLLELGNQNKYNFTDNATTLVTLRTQEGVNDARNLAIDAARNGQFEQQKDKQWTYGQPQFYNNLTNVVTSFLGTYTVYYKVHYVNAHTATVDFRINNTSGWTSATRLRKAAKGSTAHQGIIPDDARELDTDPNPGIKLGGNLDQEWQWTEPITF